MYEQIMAILIVCLFAAISLTGIIAGYFKETQHIDRLEIEHWKRVAQRAQLFETTVARKAKNGVRKVWISYRPEDKAS
jgi:hypothetical protein